MRRKTLKIAFRELCTEVRSLLDDDALSLTERFNRAMPQITDFLDHARREKTAVAFRDKFEEIYFFKFEKPEYYAQKIYVAAWFALMNGRPKGTDQQLRSYYSEELRFIYRFFQQHAFHYQYYRSGMTELDEMLFLRGAEIQPVFIPEVPELDPSFSTSGDYLFAKFMAYEALQEFIIAAIDQLDAKRVPVAVSGAKPAKVLDWTGEVINLVELGYALYVSRQIGGGKTSLAEIFRWLESSFGVEIGIPATRLRDIKKRKRLEKLRFMAMMQQLLLEYIEAEDDIYGRSGS
ncbi:RteC domain-containing protein [Nubsella zeaxanthinifaciens]|uniref:RteC domain-containing protein n=1 Tax=Nubsella zeaxanthinifaciens TaxID=392412 RepID=UPI003CFEEC2A